MYLVLGLEIWQGVYLTIQLHNCDWIYERGSTVYNKYNVYVYIIVT